MNIILKMKAGVVVDLCVFMVMEIESVFCGRDVEGWLGEIVILYACILLPRLPSSSLVNESALQAPACRDTRR